MSGSGIQNIRIVNISELSPTLVGSEITTAVTPANYSAASATIDAHLAGIDSAIGDVSTSTPMLGINATANTTDRLSVASSSSLFNHVGAGHQQKINKSTAADTASLLFQTGGSGRAEIGTTGDDDFHFKVSADGAAWHEAMIIAKATGVVTFPANSANVVRRVYAVSATWTKPAGLKAVRVTVIGGGGGGGGAAGGTSAAAAGGGGGGGGAVIKTVLAASLAATETITIGAGGAGGANTGGNASNGGTSSFGAHCSATGGNGGYGMTSGTAAAFSVMGASGSGSGGDLNIKGGSGTPGVRLSASAVSGGGGGGTMLAGLGSGRGSSNPGIPANPYGGGGGGARTATASGYEGAIGADGIVIVEEIY